MNYRAAGVDRDRAAAAIAAIARQAARTRRPEQLSAIGGFAGAFAVPQKYKTPVLLATADGVGTKLLLLRQLGLWHTAGVDLVAMNVNDILAQGGEPLFFLDYIAAGRLDPPTIAALGSGMAEACLEAGCTLLGGETAEVPDLLTGDQLELAGFAVGICEGDRQLSPHHVKKGDAVIGLSSSGAHSNGFSLIRRVLEKANLTKDGAIVNADYRPPGWDKPLFPVLLQPTRIYVKAVQPLLAANDSGEIRVMAHITGGGLPDNIQRVMPEGLGVHLDPSRWHRPPLFDWLADKGGIRDEDMFATFNMGIGFVLIVDPNRAEEIARTAAAIMGAPAWIIGEVVTGSGVTGLW